MHKEDTKAQSTLAPAHLQHQTTNICLFLVNEKVDMAWPCLQDELRPTRKKQCVNLDATKKQKYPKIRQRQLGKELRARLWGCWADKCHAMELRQDTHFL